MMTPEHDKTNPAVVHPFILMRLAAAGNVDAIRAHINAGGAINLDPGAESTPLHAAAANPCFECVEMLVKAGANVHALDERGETPLFKAAQIGLLKNGEILIDAGADIEHRCNANSSVLHACIRSTVNGPGLAERLAFIDLLIRKEVKLSLKDGQWMNPIHRAVENGFVGAIERLMAAGVSIEEKDGADVPWTPLMWATKYGRQEMIDWLVNRGANVNACAGEGNTALHVAALHTKRELVADVLDQLLTLGADPDIRNGQGFLAESLLGSSPLLQALIAAHRARAVMNDAVAHATNQARTR